MTAVFVPARYDEHLVVLAWHDVVCPEGPACRSRDLHAVSEPITLARYPQLFLEQLEVLSTYPRNAQEQPDPCGC